MRSTLEQADVKAPVFVYLLIFLFRRYITMIGNLITMETKTQKPIGGIGSKSAYRLGTILICAFLFKN
jgi:hypothetical protein